jgi:hypothetical protein
MVAQRTRLVDGGRRSGDQRTGSRSKPMTPMAGIDRWLGPGAPLTAGQVLHLQRSAGNEAVTEAFRLARRIVLSGATLADIADYVGADTAATNLRWALVLAYKDLETWEAGAHGLLTQLDADRLHEETARLKAETAQLERETDHIKGHPGYRGPERIRVLGELAGGQTSEVELTDTVFFLRHPERQGNALDPHDPADKELIKEWVDIRQHLVRSVLHSELAKVILGPKPQKRH